MHVPLFDVAADNPPELVAEVARRVAESGQYILGPEVEQFEREVEQFLNAPVECVAVGSGTDALVIALRTLDLKPGDEVVTSAFSFVATAQAIVRAGGIPVFVDVEDDDGCVHIEQVEAAVTRRTRAVVPVALFGQPIDGVETWFEQLGVPVIVDAAQAFGAGSAEIPGEVYVGAEPHVYATCFSFFPTKPLGCVGDGGMVCFRHGGPGGASAAMARALRAQGCYVKYFAELLGYNSRLDAIQAALLRRKLHEVETKRKKRQLATRLYVSLLDNVGVSSLFPHGKKRRRDDPDKWIDLIDLSAASLYPIVLDDAEERAAVGAHLKAKGVGTAVHYPRTLSEMGVFSEIVSSTPVAHDLSERILSIPLYASITTEQQRYVVDSIAEVVRG